MGEQQQAKQGSEKVKSNKFVDCLLGFSFLWILLLNYFKLVLLFFSFVFIFVSVELFHFYCSRYGCVHVCVYVLWSLSGSNHPMQTTKHVQREQIFGRKKYIICLLFRFRQSGYIVGFGGQCLDPFVSTNLECSKQRIYILPTGLFWIYSNTPIAKYRT